MTYVFLSKIKPRLQLFVLSCFSSYLNRRKFNLLFDKRKTTSAIFRKLSIYLICYDIFFFVNDMEIRYLKGNLDDIADRFIFILNKQFPKVERDPWVSIIALSVYLVVWAPPYLTTCCECTNLLVAADRIECKLFQARKRISLYHINNICIVYPFFLK